MWAAGGPDHPTRAQVCGWDTSVPVARMISASRSDMMPSSSRRITPAAYTVALVGSHDPTGPKKPSTATRWKDAFGIRTRCFFAATSRTRDESTSTQHKTSEKGRTSYVSWSSRSMGSVSSLAARALWPGDCRNGLVGI